MALLLSRERSPSISILPRELDETVYLAHPDALWVAAEKHSDEAFTIWILDLDYTYNEWRASLSVDGRWTLSPVSGPCYINVTTEIQQRLGN